MNKNIFLVLILFVASCNSSRYILSDENKEDKNYIINYITENIENGEIKSNPLIVVDGSPYRPKFELKKSKLNLKRENIEKVSIMDVKLNYGKLIWGDYAENGVVVINTNLIPKKVSKTSDESDILFFLNGKKIDGDYIKNLDNNDIESVHIIKSNNKIKLFNGENYDGVIILELK